MKERSITSSIVSEVLFDERVINLLREQSPLDLELDNDYQGLKCLSVTYPIDEAQEYAKILMYITAKQINLN